MNKRGGGGRQEDEVSQEPDKHTQCNFQIWGSTLNSELTLTETENSEVPVPEQLI